MKQFTILDSQLLYDLNKKIQQHIQQGWVPIGGIVAVPIQIVIGQVINYNYYQSMGIQ